MCPVAIVIVIAVSSHQAVFISPDIGFKPVAEQAERTKLVELGDGRPVKVDVVKEVDDPARGICIERGGISLDDLDSAEGVEVDGFDPGLSVGFRLRNIIQQDPDLADARVGPAAETADRNLTSWLP